jgi:predicted nucleic acid-binding protein
MRAPILLDAGPLVALLDRRDAFHEWAMSQWAGIEPPAITCEAVLSEVCFLLRRQPAAIAAVLEMLRRRAVVIAFCLEEELEPVSALLRRFADVPMSLADACLVRMTELRSRAAVLTLDADFRIYRRHGRLVVPVIMPGAR